MIRQLIAAVFVSGEEQNTTNCRQCGRPTGRHGPKACEQCRAPMTVRRL